jgi:hypothetical protein
VRAFHRDVAAWLPALFVLFAPVSLSAAPAAWIPARWTGGPLELERRAKAGAPPLDAAVRDAIANWYDPATLDLLRDSPFNCLLVTWSAGAADALELRQQQLVKAYAAQAHRRGIAVVGLVYPGADLSKFVPAASAARLDGLVLEGEFPPGFAEQVARAMAPAVVIPIAKDPASMRTANIPVIALEGVSPSARNLADMGIRAAPSSEPWIQSNIWLVRSVRLSEAWRPVWISYPPDRATPADYARSIADAAVAGGRWIVTLDDALRVKLRGRDPAAMATWRRIAASLRFAEEHAEWRGFVPYGNLAILVDTTAASEMADEYLKLIARRQAPYRLIARSQLTGAFLGGFRAVLATELAPPTAAERKLLAAFAENGGLVVGGPDWGDIPPGEPSVERSLGKGRMALYRNPDPESIAREMRELLSLKDAGLLAFNVPSVLTYASRDAGGTRLLVQLLNYSDSPATDITIRVSGTFKTARLLTPGSDSANLATSSARGETDITIPKLAFWGGVLLEGEIP